ncbi:hypothetical protein C8A00DRAFT_46309 [Chaetomidium leptoderma]|uniref:Protection of telomeres protein 1 n=1 Tax=Chaetomidium leptoderma TaxID=669021 RepID=A0AAN6VF37_9PEZI|nr:hypothetical protein C8A00DRAFT_46309 [Chaetomidium leptoderma]
MAAGTARKAGAAAPPPDPSLPPNYTEIRAILDETVPPGRLVCVIGVVKDCRLPIPTSGTDHKSTLTLYDLSIENESYGIKLVIFRPEADMPQVTVGDIVVMTTVKVQRYRSNPLSLITNRDTSIRVYTASKIPKPPRSAQAALAPGPKRDSHAPSPAENLYVSYIHHNIDKYSLPDEQEFRERAEQSLNVKNKFGLLKDVQEGKFYDLIAQVATEPYAGLDLATLYVSDYTENPRFHPQVWEGLQESTSGGGDPYGYTSGSPDMPKKQWVGPFGKMSMQITCFEPHATYIREEVRANQWVALRNVQVKYGRDGQYLEGFMREERNAVNSKVNVQVLVERDRDTIDPNLKEAIRRHRDYAKKKKTQIKEVISAQAAGQKRKASSEQENQHPNAKERRKRGRGAQGQKEKEKNHQKEKSHHQELRLSLNKQITCENHDAPYSTIDSIVEQPVYERTIEGQATAITIPFTCAKHKACVRVVDFFPRSLEDWVCTRKVSEFEVLSDNEDDSDSASSSDSRETPNTRTILEWRFALQLEDAGPTPDTDSDKPNERSRIWVLVDNYEAQCLTDLDAADLRQAPKTLARLRERMFTLWGDLEEHKLRAAARKREKGEAGAQDEGNRRKSVPGQKHQVRLEKPALDSSDVEEDGGGGEEPVSNKPFTCCIKQYGVNEKRAGKKEGRWVRCFGLFGTRISG